jgi:hypothetical protein
MIRSPGDVARFGTAIASQKGKISIPHWQSANGYANTTSLNRQVGDAQIAAGIEAARDHRLHANCLNLLVYLLFLRFAPCLAYIFLHKYTTI